MKQKGSVSDNVEWRAAEMPYRLEKTNVQTELILKWITKIQEKSEITEIVRDAWACWTGYQTWTFELELHVQKHGSFHDVVPSNDC